MDGDLYDEFGNYIGPELESESEEEEEEYDRNGDDIEEYHDRDNEVMRQFWFDDMRF